MTRPHMGVIAGAAVFVIALMAVPRQPASDTARPQHQPDAREETADISNASPSPAAPAPRATKVARPVVNKPALKEAPRKWPVRNVTNRTPERAKPPSPGTAAATNGLPAADASATKPAAPEPMPLPPSATPAASASQATITGCLEMSTDGKEFRLADTEGRDAPKSRSWRTGFLRKRTAPVALAGASDPLELRKSVGKRVSATGLLTDRELQVDSLRIVGSSCN